MKIGIDFGNVICGGGGTDTFFTERYLAAPELPGSYSSIRKLSKNHEIHIVSKCGKNTQEKTCHWLEEYGYNYLLTGGYVHFVRHRELKAPMALALQLDIFIDDRQDVLDWMQVWVKHPILFTSWEQTNLELDGILGNEKN